MNNACFPDIFKTQIKVDKVGGLVCVKSMKKIRWTKCKMCQYGLMQNWESGLDDNPHSIECLMKVVRFPLVLEEKDKEKSMKRPIFT